eukprot:m.236592 g.236592  ORF g.236592 m.236592 type:complete len:535 (-) comp12997_c0_seq1:1495-3099(-)
MIPATMASSRGDSAADRFGGRMKSKAASAPAPPPPPSSRARVPVVRVESEPEMLSERPGRRGNGRVKLGGEQIITHEAEEEEEHEQHGSEYHSDDNGRETDLGRHEPDADTEPSHDHESAEHDHGDGDADEHEQDSGHAHDDVHEARPSRLRVARDLDARSEASAADLRSRDSDTHSQRSSYGARRDDISIAESDLRSIGGTMAKAALRLDIKFERPTVGDKLAGTVLLHVHEGHNITGFAHGRLVTASPYVKMYLSKGGEDMRATKQKSRIHRGEIAPKFEERFVFYLPKSTPIDESVRLQLTIWDHTRLRGNVCLGGMSFSLAELSSTPLISGWFELLEEEDGRRHYAPMSEPSAKRRLGKADSQMSLAYALQQGKTHQREQHYRARISELEDSIGDLRAENSDLRTQVDQLAAREGEVRRLQDECARTRLELISCISDKEQALKQCKDLESQLSAMQKESLPMAATPVRSPSILKHTTPTSRADRQLVLSLQQRLGDVQDELQALRVYTGRLRDELMKASPKAFERASLPH